MESQQTLQRVHRTPTGTFYIICSSLSTSSPTSSIHLPATSWAISTLSLIIKKISWLRKEESPSNSIWGTFVKSKKSEILISSMTSWKIKTPTKSNKASKSQSQKPTLHSKSQISKKEALLIDNLKHFLLVSS